jgi:hypothetical protein
MAFDKYKAYMKKVLEEDITSLKNKKQRMSNMLESLDEDKQREHETKQDLSESLKEDESLPTQSRKLIAMHDRVQFLQDEIQLISDDY